MSFLPLIQNDPITHMHGFVIYVKEGLPFARDLPRKLCRFIFMFSTGFTSFGVLLPFPLLINFFVYPLRIS